MRTDLTAVVSLTLARQDRLEGSIWQNGGRSLAYAYPTHEDTGPKTGLPAAAHDQIAAINRRAASDDQPADRQAALRSQTLLLHACPLAGWPDPWLDRMDDDPRAQATRGLRRLQPGPSVLPGWMLVMSAWLGRMLVVWRCHVRGIEAALAEAGPGRMPAVPHSGERELDRIVDALNEAGSRLAQARAESEEMAARIARAEGMAGLGRVAAGVAHEIRNPIAAAHRLLLLRRAGSPEHGGSMRTPHILVTATLLAGAAGVAAAQIPRPTTRASGDPRQDRRIQPDPAGRRRRADPDGRHRGICRLTLAPRSSMRSGRVTP